MGKNNINKKQRLISIMIVIAIIIVVAIIIVLTIMKKYNYKINEPVNENFKFLVDEEASELTNIDFYTTQNNVIKEIQDDYRLKNYKIDNPKVIHNPFFNSPLSALVLFKTDKNEKVTVTLKGKHGDDLVTTFEASKDHYIPIYGLYEKYKNEIIIKTESGKSKTIYIDIDQVIETADREVIVNNIENSNGEFYFATSTLGTSSIAYDNYGEVRWFFSGDYSMGITMLKNGNMLLCDLTDGPNRLSSGGVVEIDMLGFIHRQYEFDGGFHHDALELKNGNLVVLSSNVNSDSIADLVVEIDRKKGTIVKTWDLKEIVSKIDPTLIGKDEITWGLINSISFNESNNEFILSLRNRNSVLALDYDNSNINWILGEMKYWSNKFDSYLLRGVGFDFVYPKGQTSPLINSEGVLTIFNNGYDAYKETTQKCSDLKYNESYAIHYAIDRNDMSARVIYKFGGREYFSYTLSSYNYSGKNKIFNSGWHFRSEELYDDPTCTQFSNDKYNAFIVDFDNDNNKVFEMKVNESKFEVIKANIYNLEELSVSKKKKDVISNYTFDKNTGFITSKEYKNYELLSESESVKYNQNIPNSISLFLMNNMLKFNGSVPTEMKVSLTAISLKGVGYKYSLKDSGSDVLYQANLNSLPNGRYYIFLTVDEKIYNSKYFVEIKKD